MVLSTFRRTVAALGITIAGTASGLSATAVGADPVPLEPGHTDCFGPYIARLGVIYAQPAPAITWGTAGDDIIIGSAGNDKIFGIGGDDRICAGDGHDEIYGGTDLVGVGASDVDLIDGGPGIDVLHGGWDDDTIHAGPNFTPAGTPLLHDFVYGELGDDTLYGESGPDVLRGGEGNDYCDGGTGMAGNRPEEDVVDVYCDTAVHDELLQTWP